MVLPTVLWFLLGFVVLTLLAAFFQMIKNDLDLRRHKKEIEHKAYEATVLQEIGDRVGYERDIAKIIDAIIASLSKLISYSAAGYMLVSLDRLTVRSKLVIREPVGGGQIENLKGHLKTEFLKVVPGNFPETAFKSEMVGEVDGQGKGKLNSLWITPVTIDSRGLGVVAVASRLPGQYRDTEMAVLARVINQAERAVANLEKVIESEEHKLNEMVASITDGVVMVDRELAIVVVNPAAVQLLGLPGRGQLGFSDLTSALSNNLDLRAKIESGEKIHRVETVDNLIIRDRVTQLFVSPVFDKGDKFLGTVLLFHDMTAQKQLERVREDFIAMMVHELRAPLTVVRGTADMILKNPVTATGSDGQQLLKTMEESSVQMLTLVNDLLDVAKIEAGKFQINPAPGDLGTVVHERVTFFSEMATQKSISLVEGKNVSGLTISFDRDRIEQVLNNLISNAIKFTPSGGKVTVSAEKIESDNQIAWRFGPQSGIKVDKPAILVTVADTGQGIAAKNVSMLFSKFKQLTPDLKDTTGTGLGLVITKGIVESHGGKIFMESKEGEGSTFYFTLPVDN